MSFQIETERLILRDICEADLPILIEQSLEPESLKNILTRQRTESYNKTSYENALAWAKYLDGKTEREHYRLTVERKSDRAILGSCNIYNVKPKSYETSMGWHYGYAHRNKGYATEAARELLRIGFEINDVQMIYADCFIENKASIRVLEKIGMQPFWNNFIFNTLRAWSYNEDREAVRHTITKEQWLANKKTI